MDGVSKGQDAEDSLLNDGTSHKSELPMTLHQLRIFHAVVQARTMTNAAKQLGLSQPSLSQQLGRLEASIGTRLFDRRPTEMELTEAGRYLLPRVDQVLRILNETQDGLGRYKEGFQSVIKVAGIDSVLRNLLPGAMRGLQDIFPGVGLDVQESAPADILDMLYARRIHFGLVAANSLSQTHDHFLQIPVIEDPYVLAVPADLDLDHVRDPERDLSPARLRTLHQSIHFAFGSSHGRRVTDWYDLLLPGHRPIAQCRSFETALSLVRAGTGVCLTPALPTIGAAGQSDGIRCYLIDAPPRRIVALLLSQNRWIEPMATLIAALQAGGRALDLPAFLPTPPFLANASARPD